MIILRNAIGELKLNTLAIMAIENYHKQNLNIYESGLQVFQNQIAQRGDPSLKLSFYES